MAKDPRKNTAVGIVVNAQHLTIVQACAGGSGVEILRRAVIPTPPDTVSGTEITDPVRLGQALRAYWRQYGLTARGVSLALCSPGYSLRVLRLPQIPAAERHALVRGELEQMGALPSGRGTFSYLWVDAPADETATAQANVAAFYTGDTLVDAARMMLQTAGLRLERIEPAGIAQMRAYLMLHQPEKPLALLSLTTAHTDLCIYDGAAVRQLRRIPAGSSDLTRQATPGTRDLFPDPEAPTVTTDFTATGSDFDLFPSSETPDAFQEPSRSEPAQPAAEQSTPRSDFLVSEIERTLAFYAREHPVAAQPPELVILGPTAAGYALQQLLSAVQSLPVTVVQSLDPVSLPPANAEANADMELAALGAALGDAADIIPPADLSQQEAAVQVSRRAPHLLLAGIGGASLWLCLAIAAAIGLMLLQSRAADESTRLTSEITQIKQERAPLWQYYELSQAARTAQKQTQVPAAAVLGRVAAATTPGVSLNSLTVSPDGKLLLEGQALSTAGVQQFALNLGAGQSVNLPVIETTKRAEQGTVSFRISGTFRAPAAQQQQESKE